MVCYPETNKQSNVRLYEHFEFRLAEQALVLGSDGMHDAMVRPSSPPSESTVQFEEVLK